MNAFLIVFAAVVGAASAGVAYGGVYAQPAYAGQLSTQAGLATTNSQSLRFSQSARPVAYAAAAPVAYAQQAIAAPVAYAQPAVAAYAQPAYAGQISTQAGLATTQTQSLRVSQSARPVAAYGVAAAPIAHAAVAAPAAVLGSHTAFGYTPLATQLLG